MYINMCVCVCRVCLCACMRPCVSCMFAKHAIQQFTMAISLGISLEGP